ncbi:hypothetical protein [Rhodoferax bucti]|uniref:hypothetical protein n=1 Tax=Rhodoferax bucti TaxID=2576305 RepID=UPI001109E09B|nr:hypothetical protein [Rhodoferax bucti]
MTDALNFLLETPDPEQERLARMRALLLTDDQIVAKLLQQLEDPLLTPSEHSKILDMLHRCGHDVTGLPGPVKELRFLGRLCSPSVARSMLMIAPGSIKVERDAAPLARPAAKPVATPPAVPAQVTWRGIPLTPVQEAALKSIRAASGEVKE